MHLTNRTPYDTLTLRRIVAAVWRYKWGSARGLESMRVLVLLEGQKVLVKGQKAPKWIRKGLIHVLVVRLPKLNGTEWVHLVRQEQGDMTLPTNGEGPPRTVDVAGQVAQRLNYAHHPFAVEKYRPRIPALLPLLPLQKRKEKAQRNIIRERYDRVVVLEQSWLRKQKLAATKVKKLRVKRKYYEKKLGL